jgi:hypothetical protein
MVPKERTKRVTAQTEKDLAAELYAHRADPHEWTDKPVHIEVKPTRSHVISFRMPGDELQSLHEAMQRSGENLSDYIRRALAIRIRGEHATQTLDVTSGAHALQYRTDPDLPSSPKTENPTPSIPDKPLRYVALTQMQL